MRTKAISKNISNPWTREELILALELYNKFEGRIPDTSDPDIIGLAATLADLSVFGSGADANTGRSKASIIMKLSNFRSLDPRAQAVGKVGFKNFAKADKEIWDEYDGKGQELAKAAAEIKTVLIGARTSITPLRANIHVLRLLGDELIGSPRLAVFELVKNSYDANALFSKVTINLEANNPFILVEDNGYGMSIEDLRDGWLQIGTPSKRGQNRVRTPKPFERLPLGEKGVGRLAVFRLGNRLELNTRKKGQPEFSLVMDISSIVDESSDTESAIEDVRVRISPLSAPHYFKGDDCSGTRIKISKLRDDLEWSKREIRSLQRLITSLASPFQEKKGEFKTSLSVPEREYYLRGLAEDPLELITEKALWTFGFDLTEHALYQWKYSFKPPSVLRGLTQTRASWKDLEEPGKSLLEYIPKDTDPDFPAQSPREKLFVTGEDLNGIGPIKFKMFAFDRRPEILRLTGESTQLKEFLNYQSGIRVYRDGIRVFNYGEPGDDWLELNIKRVNRPKDTLSNNAVLGLIELDLDKSQGLREKTNREGFFENNEFARFHWIINSAIDHFNRIRKEDRKAIDEILKKDPVKDSAPGRFLKASERIENIAKAKGLQDEISPSLNALKKEYETLQNLVVSSGAGLNLAIVFHEVEREVDTLVKGLEAGESSDTLRSRAKHLATILDGFGNLLRKANRKTLPISKLIGRAIELSQSRFNAHHITVSCPVLQGEDKDFIVSGAMNFYLSSLLNLIDNSIYWSRRKVELDGCGKPAIQIRTMPDWAAEGPAIAVIDNGDGFMISAEQAMQAYESTKPGGMGIGLCFARMAMEANGGDLLIPESVEDLDVDTKLKGSAVVMRFRRASQ